MTTKVQREIRRTLADMYTAVRSGEANRAIQAVTITQLLQEQVLRNGDTDASNARQFTPYSFDPDAVVPASQQPLGRANFLSGTDTNNPTKLDRVLALKNIISDLVDQVKELPVEDVSATELGDDPQGELLTSDPLIIVTEAVLADLESDSGTENIA
jgi:hypothetical protein